MLQFVTFSLDLFFPISIPDDHANLDTTKKQMTAAVIPETSIMAYKGSIKHKKVVTCPREHFVFYGCLNKENEFLFLGLLSPRLG